MHIRLSDFERQIDPTILKRGLEYFKKGYVTEVENLGHGDYEATVEGADIYMVSLHVDGDEVTGYECDCPYDWGPVCKHVAAVLFYLKNNMNNIIEKDVQPQREKQVRPKRKSEAVQIEKLLRKLTAEDLKAFLSDVCFKDKSVRRLFLAKYVSRLYPESKELYSLQVKKLLETYTDRFGFIGYHESGRLGSAVYDMLDDAGREMESGNVRKALYMSEAIIEGMYKAINCADDSNGELGGCMEDAFELLAALADKDIDKSLHDEVFGWLLGHFEAETFKGWDWHFDLMQVAISMIGTEDEKMRIRTDLEQIRPSEKDWDWNYKRAQDLMLQLIFRTEAEDAAIKFMEANTDNPDFRKELIERAIDEKDHVRAERLAKEGIKKDSKSAPGLVADWKNYLLQIYQAMDEKEKAMAIARQAFVQGSNRHHPNDYYYKLLKSLVPQTQWSQYADGLIADINRNACFGENYSRVSEIYIWEKEWDKLFGLLRNSPDFYRIESAEKYLADKYPVELADMYRRLIVGYMPAHIGRDHYKTVCRYILRMIKLGQKQMAEELIESLKTQYPSRRALLEELSHISTTASC